MYSNLQRSPAAAHTYDLKARYALGRSVAALARELPWPLADWRRCGAEVLATLAGGTVEAGSGATLRQLREALFSAPGRETEIAALWHDSLATATFAAVFAGLRGLDAGCAIAAALLHRAGEAAAVRALALAESASGVQVDAEARAQIVAQNAPAFLDALVRGWRLPPEVAVTARGWQHFGEVLTERACAAVYVGNLLALELLQADCHSPRMVEDVAAELGVPAAQLATLRAAGPTAQALIERLG